MAYEIGVSREYISNIETGNIKLPAYVLYVYCIVCKVSPAYLMRIDTMGSEDISRRSGFLNGENKSLVKDFIELLVQRQNKNRKNDNG